MLGHHRLKSLQPQGTAVDVAVLAGSLSCDLKAGQMQEYEALMLTSASHLARMVPAEVIAGMADPFPRMHVNMMRAGCLQRLRIKVAGVCVHPRCPCMLLLVLDSHTQAGMLADACASQALCCVGRGVMTTLISLYRLDLAGSYLV